MATTPAWASAVNGFPGNLNATNESAQINQNLGTHVSTELYESAALVSPAGGTALTWLSPGNATDVDQPFVLPSARTAIGRVTIPIKPFGSAADLLVTLWPDSGGSPDTSGTSLSQTFIPASWFLQQSAVDGLSIDAPPLAGPQNNTTLYTSTGTAPWVMQAGSSTVNASNSSAFTSGNYLILAGGVNADSVLATTAVGVSQFSGSNTFGLPQSAPALPKATLGGALAATSDTVLVCGGAASLATLNAPFTNVWTASWDPNTGTVGNWSSQTALPSGLVYAGAAAYNGFVYIVGGGNNNGVNSSSTLVYYAAVSNGSLTSWVTGPPLPVAKNNLFVTAINGWLIATGGIVDSASTAATPITYYAQIRSDGSLSSWNIGPSLPISLYSGNSPTSSAMGDYWIIAGGVDRDGGNVPVNHIWVLPVTSAGLGSWSRTYGANVENASFAGSFVLGNGGGTLISVDSGTNDIYSWFDFTPAPLISVPLPATGLTATATYHVVMQQNQTPDESSYLSIGYQAGTPLPNGYQVASRGTASWSTPSATTAVPMTVYDQTASGQSLHIWEDPSNRMASGISTFINEPNSGKITGLCESTLYPGNALNANPTFNSGVASWTPTSCAFAQSSTQTHGGFAFSGRITPNGSSALVYVQSELIDISSNVSLVNGQYWLTPDTWVWSTSGSSAVSNSVNWFDSTGTYLSTSSNFVSVSATTWTHLTNVFEVPVGAAIATVVPTIGGTPASGNLFYLSNAMLVYPPFNSRYSSYASVIEYGSDDVPVGVTQLN